MSKHTKGPLAVKQQEKFPFDISIVDANGVEVFHERRHAYGSNQKSVAQVMAGSCFDNAETRAAAVESNARQLADAHLRAAAPDLLAVQTMGAQLNTPDFLNWIADRLVHVHGDDPNADFIHTLRNRAEAGRKAMNKALGEQNG